MAWEAPKSNVRWGIQGTGAIAHRFAACLRHVPDATLVAVGSRSDESARRFADHFQIPRAHGSYVALAADSELDIVHVATPNRFHFEHATQLLRAKKAVLLEKPFAVNARQAAALIAVARAERVFLMEAMWTRFMPAVRRALEWIKDGAIGDVRLVEASFGFRSEPHELDALVSRELATGSILDVGVYAISLAHAALGGPPSTITGHADLAASGVDRQCAFVLGWPGGALAVGASSVTHETSHDAFITGTAGRIHLHAPFWCAPAATLCRPGRSEFTFEAPSTGEGFEHEATAVGACLREDKLEHPALRLQESLEIMRTLDALRATCGVRFDADTASAAGSPLP